MILRIVSSHLLIEIVSGPLLPVLSEGSAGQSIEGRDGDAVAQRGQVGCYHEPLDH